MKTKFASLIFGGGLVILCGGCETPIHKISAENLARRLRVETSPYDSSIFYYSQDIQESVGLDCGLRYNLRTIRLKRRPSVVAHQLYIEVHYILDNWVFYTRASDNESRDLKVHRIDSDVRVVSSRSTRYSEEVAVSLPDGYLASKVAEGFSVRLSAKNGVGAVFIEVPPNYIEGHLRGLARAGCPVAKEREPAASSAEKEKG